MRWIYADIASDKKALVEIGEILTFERLWTLAAVEDWEAVRESLAQLRGHECPGRSLLHLAAELELLVRLNDEERAIGDLISEQHLPAVTIVFHHIASKLFGNTTPEMDVVETAFRAIVESTYSLEAGRALPRLLRALCDDEENESRRQSYIASAATWAAPSQDEWTLLNILRPATCGPLREKLLHIVQTTQYSKILRQLPGSDESLESRGPHRLFADVFPATADSSHRLETR
jgi:hypothetical protein